MFDIASLDDLIGFYDQHHAEHGGARGYFMCSRTCLLNWKTRGIPGGWHSRIIFDLMAAGKSFDPALFDAEDHPGAKVANHRATCAQPSA